MRSKNFRLIFRLVIDIFFAFGFVLLLALAAAWFYEESVYIRFFGISALAFLLSCGSIRHFLKADGVRRLHAASAMALAWVLLSLFSSIPLWMAGVPGIDAVFEAFSGWTDTGLTMIPDPEILPFSVGLFRVLTQWVSGLGIVFLILMLHGSSPRAAWQFFKAEQRSEDFSTSIWAVGRTIALIYFAYTLLGFLVFLWMGLPTYHALIHAITSLSTGGFSSNSVGVGLYGVGPTIAAIVLMLMGGISFSSHRSFVRGDVKAFFRNPEVRALGVLLGIALVFVLTSLAMDSDLTAETTLAGVFYVASAVSTAGAGTVLPLHGMPEAALFVVVLLMISGSVYGSTTGGIKLWRILILGKIIQREVRRPILPENSIQPIIIGTRIVSEREALQVSSYIVVYILLAMIGIIIFLFSGYDLMQSIFTIFSAQGNVGLNIIRPAGYFGMHPLLKLQLILHMLLGRMEIFPLFYLLHLVRE